MTDAGSPHPSARELAAFAHGKLSPQLQALIADHVAGCAACCAVLRAVPDDTLLGRLRQAPREELGAPEPAPPRPSETPSGKRPGRLALIALAPAACLLGAGAVLLFFLGR